MSSFDTLLELGDETLSKDPTPQDIAAAIARPRGENWALSLSRGDDDFVLAMLDSAGGVEVDIDERGASLFSDELVTDEKLQAIFESFLAGDGKWRDVIAWKAPPPPSAVAGPREALRVQAPVVVVLGAIGLAMVSQWLGFPRVTAFVGAVFIPLFFGAAAYEKWREVKAASTWTKGTAKIVRSGSRILTREDSEGRKTEGRVPAIEYEFSVGLKPMRGTRISIGEIMPDSPEVEAALKRYPQGASAPVYFDPKDPRRCVLERDPPASFTTIFGVVGALAAIAGGAALWFTRHW